MVVWLQAVCARYIFASGCGGHCIGSAAIPRCAGRQQVIDVEVKIQPETELETTIDSFDSVVMTGFAPEPHDMFSYSVTGIAFVDNEHIKKEIYKPLYRFNSALTIPGPSVEAMIAVCRDRLASLPADATPVQQAAEVMDEVYKAFVYTPGSTTIRTTAEQALAQRKGVCQDYAHVMLSVCRHVGLTARYIAGLLGGEGATHAWVEVYQDGRWVGLDPTHNRLVDDNYITIAHGRDYRDCMLDIGIFSGYNVQQTQWVNASVHEQVA